MTERYTNEHTFYVINKTAPSDKLSKWIRNRIVKISRKIQLDIDPELYFNQVTNKENASLGFGYLWVVDPRAYNIINGRNPDGSERVEFETIGNLEELEAMQYEELDKLNLEPGMSWADFEEIVDEIKNKYRPELKKVVLPPLMEFDHMKEIDDTFLIKPAEVKKLSAEYCENVICSSSVPDWLTDVQIKKSFEKYTSDPEASYTKTIRSSRGDMRVTETYPGVSISNAKMVFITFNPLSKDAQFALTMNTKVTFVNPRNPKASCTLIFRQLFNRR